MKFSYLIIAILLFINTVQARTWNIDSKDAHLELELETEIPSPLIEGDHPTIQGHFCLRIEKPNHCKLLTPEDLSKYDVKFFYPDITQNITSSVVTTLREDRHDFSFELPDVIGNENPTFTAQIFNKGSKVEYYQKMLAKFYVLKSKLLENKTHWPKLGTVKINNLVNTLAKVEARIKLKLQGESALIAKREFPFQVKNNIAKPSSWTNAAEEWQVEVDVGLGVSFEGEKTWINLAFTPYVTNTYDWKIEYRMDGNLLSSKTIENPTSILTERFLTDKLATGNHNVKITIYNNDRKNGNNPKWNITFDKSYSFLTLNDGQAPDFLNITPTPGRYVSKNMHTLSYTAIDSLGRINASSIKAIFNLQNGEQLDLSSDLNYLTNGQVLVPEIHGNQEGSSSYIVNGTFSNLPEGIHHLALQLEDFAENEAKEAEWTFIYDRTSPLILLPFSQPFSTNEESLILPVTIADLTKTHFKIHVNGVLQFEADSTDGNFSDELSIDLIEGINLVTLEAIDEAGNVSSINIPPIILDTTPPALASLNLNEGQIIRTEEFRLSGSANEVLKEIQINGVSLESTSSSTSFATVIKNQATGDQNLTIKLTDLLGNVKTIEVGYRVQLNILRIELVSITPTPNGKLLVTGSINSAKPGIDIEVDGGFFNSESGIVADDGSFSFELDPFSVAEITAEDSIDGIVEKYSLNFNADTTLSGIVKDPNDVPIPGVTVTIVSTGQATTTDMQGVFNIAKPALGDQKIFIDGRTVPLSYTDSKKEFSAVTLNVAIGKLQQNVLERPIYISPKLLDGSETVIMPDEPAVVQSIHAPGVSIEIPANAVSFPDGGPVGSINILEIDASKTSVEMPEGVEPGTVYALEPSGLTFKEPIKLTLPNTNDFPEGIELVILSKNSSSGLWEINGSATVVGNTIETKPGQGITHFSEVFAAPFGMQISALGPKDKPGVENKMGELTTSIALPSYTRLGSSIEPKFIYKSSWANPTAIVSNVFKIPKMYYEFSGSLSKGTWAGKVKGKETIETWLTPDSIDTQFFVKDLASEKLTFRAESAPENAVVSYAVDLSNLPSGVYPATANYEVKYRNLTIRTTKIKSKDLFGKTKTRVTSTVDKDILESIFPPDLNSLLFHQNKKHSEYGAGWKLEATQQIINPGEDRIMIENADGSVASYTLKNSVETIYTDTKDIDVAYLSGNTHIVRTTDNIIKKVENGSAQTLKTLPNYAGVLGVNTAWTWRFDRTVHVIKCGYYHANYDVARKVNSLFPMGMNIAYADSLGAILNIQNDYPYAGTFGTLQKLMTFETNDYQPHCNAYLGTNCGGTGWQGYYYIAKPYASGSFQAGDCNNPSYCYKSDNSGCIFSPVESQGQLPAIGYATGAANQSKLNNPMAIIAGQEANTLIIADTGNNLVRKINLGTNTISNIAGNQQTHDNGDGLQANQASLYHPRGLAYDVTGNLFISTENGYIRRVSPSGVITTLAGKPLGQGGQMVEVGDMKTFNFKSPSSLHIDNENGLLYVADTGNHRIVSIDLEAGIARVVAGNGQCTTGPVKEGLSALQTSICHPVHIGMDNNKNLLFLDKSNKRIRKVIFTENTDGIQRFASTQIDNTELVKNVDGTYQRLFRDGSVITFNQSGLQVRAETLAGLESKFEYDDQSRLIAMTDPSGSTSTIQYSGDKISTFTDPTGKTTSFNYSGDQLLEANFPDGTSKSFNYTDKDLLIQEINQRGYATQYTYNDWNRLSSVKNPDNTIIQLEDYQSKTFANSYNSGDRNLVNYSGTNAEGLSDSIKNAKSAETIFVRDTNGYTTTIIDAENKQTLIDRDSEGRPTKITKPDLSNTIFTYDQMTGDLLTKHESSTNTTERFEYDTRGQLTSHTDHANRISKISYHSVTSLPLVQTDPNNRSTSRTYGNLGLVASITNPLNQTQSYLYDENGNISKITAPLGEMTTYLRDDAGNVKTRTNAKGQKTTYVYDAFNRLKSVTTPDAKITEYSYLETGELSQILDPVGNKTIFNYDSMGRLIKKTSPLNQVTQLSYDANGNIQQEIDPKGQTKGYEYNDIDKLVKKTLPDNVYQFTYNSNGNLETISDNDSSFQYGYTQIHGKEHLTSIEQSVLDIPSNTIEYSKDILGRTTGYSTSYRSIQYTLGNNGEILSLTNDRNEAFNFGYDNAYRLISINRSGGFSSTFSYDANSFLTSILHKKNSTQATLNSFNYTRDQISNRSSMTTLYGTSNYQYDEQNQLISAFQPEAEAPHQLETFSYDSLGNRTQDNNGSFSHGEKKFRLEEDYKYLYAYDSNGNLVSKQEKGMTGNLTNFTYSSENQIVAIDIYQNGNIVRRIEYSYDALGRRTQKSISENNVETIRKYVYEGNEIIAELNAKNDILVRYTHSGSRTDDTLAMEVTSTGVASGISPTAETFYFIKDGQGSIIDITDSSGSVVQHYTYNSYGKILKISSGNVDVSTNPKVKSAYTYTNREFDAETGLHYYRARYYDPSIGRFISEDPHPGTLSVPATIFSKYSYVQNNPYNFIDPSGKWSIGPRITIGGDVGKVFGTLGEAYTTYVLGTMIGLLSAMSVMDSYKNGSNFQDGLNSFLGAKAAELAIVGLAALNPSSAIATGSLQGMKSLMVKGSFSSNLLGNVRSGSANSIFGFLGVEMFAPSWAIDYIPFVGGAFAIKDLADTACSDDATTFTRTNLCYKNL